MTCDYFKDDTDDALLQISQINSKKSLTARNKPTEVVQYTEMTFCLILNEEFISLYLNRILKTCIITNFGCWVHSWSSWLKSFVFVLKDLRYS